MEKVLWRSYEAGHFIPNKFALLYLSHKNISFCLVREDKLAIGFTDGSGSQH